jgi:ubiquinone/menaquinone biosynthesis C-methylase UbiE
MPSKPRQNRKSGRPRSRPRSGGPAQTHWSEVADWYDRLVGDSGSEYQREVVLPGVIRLLAPSPGQLMLDVACGQGVLCRLLYERGVAMTGIDASHALIESARQRNTAIGSASIKLMAPHYQLGDARELSFLPADHFDAAACVLAIQNINPVQPVFQGVARTLKSGGRFVIAMMHPAFRGTGETSWGWDQEKQVQYRRVDRYLLPRKSPIITHPGQSADSYTWTFHKPIEAYVKAARNAGLLIDALEEWPSHKSSTSGPRAPAENAARKEIPMFLAMRAIKVDLSSARA